MMSLHVVTYCSLHANSVYNVYRKSTTFYEQLLAIVITAMHKNLMSIIQLIYREIETVTGQKIYTICYSDTLGPLI